MSNTRILARFKRYAELAGSGMSAMDKMPDEDFRVVAELFIGKRESESNELTLDEWCIAYLLMLPFVNEFFNKKNEAAIADRAFRRTLNLPQYGYVNGPIKYDRSARKWGLSL